MKENEELQCFDFDGAAVRVVDIEKQPWWVAADVCRVLDLTNPSVAIAELDEDERAKYCLGRQGDGNIISESGLYNLIFKSRKPEAKRFRKWVTSEVLPAIRKTGKYAVESDEEEESRRQTLRGLENEVMEVSESMRWLAYVTKDRTMPLSRVRASTAVAGRRMEAVRLMMELMGVGPRPETRALSAA